ncbi:helix-turn-helix transcriptional regulator [Pantoea eucalypti]|uniref:helix-turn-helix transcriptional regulator n=1 Tax=Pantoea eucalypti TaxID=470933 RepID=UPI0024BB089F|nr:helix-turn-helix transcriptional regulator [Pantoea eucalypti]MDJ0475614.1 helix-turn-helix transcriptional regulator [Pantoea eucalypti]
MKLNDYLQKNALTQAEFASLVGVSQGYVSQVLTGKCKLRGSAAIKWSQITNWQVTPHELNSSDYPNVLDGVGEINL